MQVRYVLKAPTLFRDGCYHSTYCRWLLVNLFSVDTILHPHMMSFHGAWIKVTKVPVWLSMLRHVPDGTWMTGKVSLILQNTSSWLWLTTTSYSMTWINKNLNRDIRNKLVASEITGHAGTWNLPLLESSRVPPASDTVHVQYIHTNLHRRLGTDMMHSVTYQCGPGYVWRISDSWNTFCKRRMSGESCT